MGIFKKKEVRYNIPKCDKTPTSFKRSIGNVPEFCYDHAVDQNPDRCFRGELYLTLGSGNEYPENQGTAMERLESQMAKFEEEQVKNYQLYIYLIEFYNKSLSQEALAQMTKYFQKLEQNGLRVLLRFAYEYSADFKKGPTTKQIKEHCQQIKQWIAHNRQLFNKTVYAMQVGIIGLWGEGHGSRHKHKIDEIVSTVFEMVPEDMTVMCRLPIFIDKTPEKYRDRVSIHDDFLIGEEHIWGMIPFNHPDNASLYTMAQHRITDGEMPWGKDKTFTQIDPVLLIKQCKNYGLRTLSIEHNYKEDSNSYHLEKWKNTYLTEQQLVDNEFPYFPPLLERGKISVFDYLKCHLGYLLAVTNLSKENGMVVFDLFNFGIGAPIDFNLEIVADGQKVDVEFDAHQLCQFSSIHFEIPCENELKVGLFHTRDKSLSIKLANKLEYKDGYNKII